VWDWVLQNKTWLFSGGGLTALAVIWWAIKKIVTGRKASANGLVNQPQVSINLSPTFNQSNTQTASLSEEREETVQQQQPDIRFIKSGSEFAQRIGSGKKCFVLSFRNDGAVDATNVIAHIAYTRSPRHSMVVDYGAWIEHEPIINIFRGYTKRLIFAVLEDGKNFAVTDTGPSSNYTDPRVESVGEIVPAKWQMVVTLSADDFRKNYVFNVIVSDGGNLLCYPEGTPPPQQIQSPPGGNMLPARPNVCSLRPEVTTVMHDAESDVWFGGNGVGAINAVLLPFSNEPRNQGKTAAVTGLKARLTYYKGDGIEIFKRIDSGCWIDTS
jgi:hypothetical protein